MIEEIEPKLRSEFEEMKGFATKISFKDHI